MPTRRYIFFCVAFIIVGFIASPFAASQSAPQLPKAFQPGPSNSSSNRDLQAYWPLLPKSVAGRAAIRKSLSSAPRLVSTPLNPATPIFFESPAFASGGQNAESVAVADVNRDGKPDVLVANLCSDSACANHGSVGVLLGNGNGIFQSAATYDSGGYSASAIAVGDVNRDGKLDIIVANECGSSTSCTTGSVGVLLGNGDGTFQPAVTYSSGGEGALSLAVSYVNNDGKLDIVVGNSAGTVGVLLGNGDSTFQPVVTYAAGGGATGVVVADVNDDGKPDLVVANFGTSDEGLAGVSVLLGNGNGTFQAAAVHSIFALYGTSVAVADVNEDGKLDILVTCQTDPGAIDGFGLVGVLLGNGDGTFQPAELYQTGGYGASSVAVTDVNGDGKPDLLIANPCVGYECNGDAAVLGVLLGNGDGTFQNAITYNQGYGAVVFENFFGFAIGGSIAVADVNGDGEPDVLATSNILSSGGVNVLLGNANGSFHAAANYNPTGFDSVFVAAGDVNGDGKPDLLVLDRCVLFSVCPSPLGGFLVGVLLGNGDGTFQPAVSYLSDVAGAVSAALALADVNGDGKPDLLMVSPSGPVLEVALGNGDGTFQAASDYALNFSPNYVAAADVNGDGKIDALVTDTEGVEVLLGNGNGTFQPPVEYATVSAGESVVVGDVNGDGKLDMIVANLGNGTANSGSVSVLLGNGNGTFQTPVTYSTGAVNTTGVALADMNGDGKPDLVVTSQYENGSSISGVVGVLLGNGDGTFQPPLNILTPIPLGDVSLAVADFNGDGKLDVAVGYGDILLLGNGNGTFQPPVLLGASGLGIASADFNGDGRPDLAVGGVTVLLNVSLLPTTTSLSSSQNPSRFGENVTFTATVSHPGPDILTGSGTVTFFDGTGKLGSQHLNSRGKATLSISTLCAGTHKITAVYSGNPKFARSESPVFKQVVRRER
jgi:Bacterial Ig-like domain (group 3)/FG-GAP-like repeat/FG-GAP repeat